MEHVGCAVCASTVLFLILGPAPDSTYPRIDLYHEAVILKQSEAFKGAAMAKRAERQEKNSRRASGHLGASFKTGLAEITSFGNPAKPISSPHADVASALRNDWIRIGRDMGKVLARKQNG